ncbi:MAG: histidinol-phosphatase HisJ family protein, partial [Lentisphaeria bacterium]|nr:histidinol-phosphatase HisJ family protein [Lentisphaeria bacterium]
MTNTSLHNHSTWSDGAADITAMATAARDAGLNVFGISDHWVMLPPGCRLKTEWSISADRLDGYFQECLAVRKQVETERFSLRIGLEVDFFPETWQENMALLARYPLDYTIGSIHYLDDFPIDSSPAPWKNLDQDSINDLWRQYWLRVRALAETRAFTIIGHLDLPKKFGFTATADLNAEIDAALLAIRESGAQLELNTAG